MGYQLLYTSLDPAACSKWVSSAGPRGMLVVCLHVSERRMCKVPVAEDEWVCVEQHTNCKAALKLTSKDSKDLALRHLLSNPIWLFLSVYQKNSSTGIFKQTARKLEIREKKEPVTKKFNHSPFYLNVIWWPFSSEATFVTDFQCIHHIENHTYILKSMQGKGANSWTH